MYFFNFNPLSEEESAKENIENFFKGANCADLDQVRPLSAHMNLSYLDLLSADLCGSDAI